MGHVLHPEMQAILDRRNALALPGFAGQTPAAVRAAFATGQAALPAGRGAAVARIEDDHVMAAGRLVPIRRYRPVGPVRGRLLYFHGGGWVFGTLNAFDPVCRELAAATGAEVVSVEYGLAPENPYPGPLDDAWAALLALGEPGVPLAVAGDSAGGNLAAALALRARDEAGPPIRVQVLLYPVLDPSCATDSYGTYGGGRHLISAADMRWFWEQHVPAERLGEAYAAPARAACLRDVPEALIVLAGCDPLHDEGIAYAEALRSAGVPVTVRDHPDMAHGFFTLIDLIARANEEARAVGALVRRMLAEA